MLKVLTVTGIEKKHTYMKRYGNLIPEIITRENLEASFNEVTCDLAPWSKKHFLEHKEKIIEELQKSIGDGSFRITRFEEFEVVDGPKRRKVQSPPVKERIGCNAVMRVVEKYVYPTVIPTSAASIPGRGMHYLFKKMRSDVSNNPEECTFFYKCDIKKFYESIDQDIMKMVIRQYIKDPVLLPILDNFITVMEHGLSIGLRSSQCFGNLLLSHIDHVMKEKYHVRFYYRYCDDICFFAATKERLWWLRDRLHEEVALLGLTIKTDEAVRPLPEGVDFLGFVYDGERSRIRKRTKQKFARHMAKVKSFSRKKKLVASFYGMAKWGDCRNLLKSILKMSNFEFSKMKISVTAEGAGGKKMFNGGQVKLSQLMGQHITIQDFLLDVPVKEGERTRTLVSFQYDNGAWGKYFTADKLQTAYLIKFREENLLPMGVVISAQPMANGKLRYYFT